MQNQILLLIVYICFLTAGSLLGQDISADEIISKSIAYHDPKGLLTSKELTFNLTEERPNGTDRQTAVVMDTPNEFISISTSDEKGKTKMTWKKGQSSFLLNGSDNISKEDISSHRLTHDRLIKMKDYYRYLWHLPITLQDPGTVVKQEVEKVDFFGSQLWEVRVTYESEVGSDIWYFYFDDNNYALKGYRFYHDEAANDGEYILLSEEVVFKTLRLPQRREWYTHKEGKYLGADVLTSIN